jgi:hypothetical protein
VEGQFWLYLMKMMMMMAATNPMILMTRPAIAIPLREVDFNPLIETMSAIRGIRLKNERNRLIIPRIIPAIAAPEPGSLVDMAED